MDIDAYGGGVCQVSTTLYNAALLANLEIEEVHSHSLKVGYIEPAFDAMVNSGSSDLKIKNNTDMPIIIATSYNDDECLIRIYGMKNKYYIERKYEFSEIKSNDGDVEKLVIPESMAISKLLIYDENGFKEEKFIREVKYKALYSE